jgi:hypothetical protein
LKPVLKPGGFYSLSINNRPERLTLMKNTFARFALLASKVNRQHLQFIFAIIVLAMLVLGIGAPADGSSISPH